MSRTAEPAAGRTPLSREEAHGLLREALAMSTADHTSVVLEARDESLTRFANNEIHQNVASRQQTLTLEAVVGRRRGLASTSRMDSSGLRQLADQALALARLSPEDEDLPPPSAPAEPAPLPAFVDATAACTPEARAEAVGEVTEAATQSSRNAAGALTTMASVLAVADSGGRFAYHPDTYANFTCTVRGPGASGWVDRHRRDWHQLDVAGLGRMAIDKAERSRNPREIPPGRYTVVLEPNAVAELVAFLAWLGLGAQSEQEGRSFLSGRLGQSVTGAGITVVDDAFDPRSLGRPFDYEGTPRQRMALIENGVARAVVHDRRTAHKAGVASTGHACPPPAVEGPIPFDLVLAGGTQTLDELIATTERGILVTRFWYNRVVDARRTIITGMTRDGTIMIEQGRLTHGLVNLRFNESVLEVLARADGIGRDAEPTRFAFSGNTVVAPALRVRDFAFTGVTRF